MRTTTLLFIIMGSLSSRIAPAVGSYGPLAILVLMSFESVGAPFPSEVIQPFAGFLASSGKLGFFWAVAAGVAGNMIGSWIAYFVGLKGGRKLLLRYGRYVGIREKELTHTERWFERWGQITVFTCRLLPIARGFVSYPAGAAQMNLVRFSLYTFLGCVPWVFGLTYAGYLLSNNWQEVGTYLHYLTYAVILAIFAGAVYLFVRWRLRRTS